MYALQKPMTQAEIIAQQANLLVELERKGRELEQQGKEHDNRISALEQSVADIRAIKNIQLDNWRLHIRPIINKIAQNYPLLDGMEQKDTYKAVWHELYDRLEASMRCNLKIRLANMKMRAKKAGASQQELSKLGRLDVIKENPRLVVGLKSVLHDMMIKYCNSGE